MTRVLPSDLCPPVLYCADENPKNGWPTKTRQTRLILQHSTISELRRQDLETLPLSRMLRTAHLNRLNACLKLKH